MNKIDNGMNIFDKDISANVRDIVVLSVIPEQVALAQKRCQIESRILDASLAKVNSEVATSEATSELAIAQVKAAIPSPEVIEAKQKNTLARLKADTIAANTELQNAQLEGWKVACAYACALGKPEPTFSDWIDLQS